MLIVLCSDEHIILANLLYALLWGQYHCGDAMHSAVCAQYIMCSDENIRKLLLYSILLLVGSIHLSI